MASAERLARFISAMDGVYRFSAVASAGQTTLSSWSIPPASAGHRGRYLWTDAFGVLNFLTLHQLTKKQHYLQYAKSLVSKVHSVLGRTRDQSALLPGASTTNPLGGGLRIGKEDATGSDGDGQYHRYLTLWMFGPNRLAVVSGDMDYNKQAISLAEAIHPAFVYQRQTERPRMYWKVTMDLKAPLVSSEGNLDPLDGLVVFQLLQSSDGPNSSALHEEIDDYRRIVRSKLKQQGFGSSDTLDMGMTLWTLQWLHPEEGWFESVQERNEAQVGQILETIASKRHMDRRLAFREFGHALGIKCALASRDSKWPIEADKILESWEAAGLVPKATEGNSAGINASDELLPISQVMYAAALIPGVFCAEC